MLESFINEIEAIDINMIVWRVLSRHQDELTELQKSRLHKGLRTDNVQLSPYSNPHIKVRIKHGRPTDPKDLDLTGSHYGKMFTLAQKDSSLMGSDDWKTNILEWAWGKEIYGLTPEDIEYCLFELGWADEMAEEYNLELTR